MVTKNVTEAAAMSEALAEGPSLRVMLGERAPLGMEYSWWLFILLEEFLWDRLERALGEPCRLICQSCHRQHCLGTMLTITDTQALTPEPLKCWL